MMMQSVTILPPRDRKYITLSLINCSIKDRRSRGETGTLRTDGKVRKQLSHVEGKMVVRDRGGEEQEAV